MGLLDLLPERYGKSWYTVEIQAALEKQLDKLQAEKVNTMMLLGVRTSGAGIELWEKQYAVDPGSQTIVERQEAVLAKMRGVGTATTEMIRSVVQSYYQKPVEIIEIAPEYRFIIVIDGEEMASPRREDATKALYAVQPAHLQGEYLARTRAQGSVWAGGYCCVGIHMGVEPDFLETADFLGA